MELGLRPENVQGRTFFYGEGCKVCNNTGYKGRTAIFEMFIGTENLKHAIANKVPLAELKKVARKDGMRTLRESGIISIYDGTTTIEEIVKETVFH